MTFRRARTIDELAAEVADAETVVSPRAPLTLALDRRATRPRLGRAAATPQSHVTGEYFPNDRRELFHQLVQQSELSWRQADRALQLSLDSWNRTGDRQSISGHQEFATDAIEETVEFLSDADSIFSQLERAGPLAGDVAVIEPEALTPLDSVILPTDATAVSPFAAGSYDLPPLHLFPTATDIVNSVTSHLTAENADDVAIVVDQQSIYPPLLESALETADIPYQGQTGFLDTDANRGFLRLLQASFHAETLTVGQLRPLLSALGLSVPRTHDDMRVDHVTAEPGAGRIDEGAVAAITTALELLEQLTQTSFNTAVAQYEAESGDSLAVLRTELEALGLADAPVSKQSLDALVYYLQRFEVPVENDSAGGVLLADASVTAYADRPVVFYLGLGSGWAQSPPDRPWIDSEAFVTEDKRRFELLLQNGRDKHRYYFAQESMAGSDVRPCVYLREAYDIERFDELEHVRHGTGVTTEQIEPFTAPTPQRADDPTSVSQSTLNRLANSPRDHFFSRLVDSPTTQALERGSVLHEAAEIQAISPEVFIDRRDALLDTMCDRLAPYVSDAEQAPLRTQLAACLTLIEAYRERYSLATEPTQGYADTTESNQLATQLGLDVESAYTEQRFENATIGVHGIVDLIESPTTIVDYKTGRPKSVRDIRKDSAVTDISTTPDYQALLYLAHHRDAQPEMPLTLRFVYLQAGIHQVIKNEPIPFDDMITEIQYRPESFAEFVASEAMFNRLTDYSDGNPRRKVLDTLGLSQYQTFFREHPLPRADRAPEQRAEIKSAFRALAVAEVGDYKYVQTGVDKIFGDMESTPPGYLLAGDIDDFEAFLTEQLSKLQSYHETRFPVSLRPDGPNWDRVDHRDLIVTGGEASE